MKVQSMEISLLRPYEKNAKRHSEEQINNVAESIRQFGWKQPIVIDKENVVVIGHCRLLAAQHLGLSEVPVLIADDLTPEQIRELRIVDNKTNESPWDMEILSLELGKIDLDPFDFDFGIFDDHESYVDDFFETGVQEKATKTVYAVKIVFQSEEEVDAAMEALVQLGYAPVRL